MFKRFNRAKMLALVASLGAFGANVNSNAGAVNKAVPVAAGAAGGLLTGIIGMAAFVKYSNFGKKLAFSNELKYLAEVIKEAKVDTLYIKIDKSANVKVKLDNGDRKKVNGILEKRIGKALGYDKKEQLEKLTKEEAEKLLSKITPLFADMVSKFNGGLNYLSFDFGKILVSSGVFSDDSVLEFKVSAGKKGNLNFFMLVNGDYVKHSAKGANNVDEEQKAIDEYIDKVKNALEKHPAIQAIKESKSKDENSKPASEIVLKTVNNY